MPTCTSLANTFAPAASSTQQDPHQYQPSYSSMSTNSSSDRGKKSNSNISTCQTNKLVHNGTLNSINFTITNNTNANDHDFSSVPFHSPKIYKKQQSNHSPTDVNNMDTVNDMSSYSSSTIIKTQNGPGVFTSTNNNQNSNKHDASTLDRQNSQTSSKKKQALKKQKSFSSSSTTTNTFSSSLSTNSRTNDYNIAAAVSTAADATASINSQCSSSMRKFSNLKGSPTRSYHSLSYREPDEHTKYSATKVSELKKPVSTMMLNEDSSKKSPKHLNMSSSNRVLSVLKMYKNVLNKIQKPANQSSLDNSVAACENSPTKTATSTQKSSLSASCLNKLNTKALLNSQFNCVRSTEPYANNVDSSSSIFSYEFHQESPNCVPNDKHEKIFDNINLSELEIEKSNYNSLKKSSPGMENTNSADIISVSKFDENVLVCKASEPCHGSLLKQAEPKQHKHKHSDAKIQQAQPDRTIELKKSSKVNSCKQNVNSNSNTGTKVTEWNSSQQATAVHPNVAAQDEDMLCDMEVASFFNNKKQFKTSIIQLDGNNFCYCYEETDAKSNDFQQIQGSVC